MKLFIFLFLLVLNLNAAPTLACTDQDISSNNIIQDTLDRNRLVCYNLNMDDGDGVVTSISIVAQSGSVTIVDVLDPSNNSLSFSGSGQSYSYSNNINITNGDRIYFEIDNSNTPDNVLNITVNFINSAPVIANSQSFDILDNASNADLVGTVSATEEPTSFAITAGNSDNVFAIDNQGNITILDNSNLDHATTPSYTLTISATNAVGTSSNTVTINVDDGSGSAGVDIPNFHKCGVFPSVLTSHQTITSNNNAEVFGSDSVYAASTSPSPFTMGCTTCNGSIFNPMCWFSRIFSICSVEAPPANTLSWPFFNSSSTSWQNISSSQTFTGLNIDGLNISGSSLNLRFTADTTYDDNARKVMFLKSLNVSASDTTYIFDEGDYFIGQWNFGTDTTIEVNGNVRLFIDGNMPINNGTLKINSGGDVGDMSIFVDGDVTFPSSFDAHSYFYSTGNFNANGTSSPQGIRGAFTSEGNMNLGTNQMFYYDDSGLEANGFSECSSAPVDSNSYGCDMFGSVIVTYDFLDVSGTANAQACGTENISYPSGQISGSIDCLSDIACGGTGAECEQSDPPANQLTYTWTHPDNPIVNESPIDPSTLSDVSYGNVDYSGGSVTFAASTLNSSSGTNYMYIGDATFDQTLITFEAGDYYFESFSITKNKNDVNNFVIDSTNGPVRIFIKNDLSFELNNLYLNHSGDPGDLFIYVGNNFINPGNGGGNTHMNAYLYVEGNVTLNNNSNNWIIEGGITAEGQITIAGNNPDFIESNEADSLGYGECALCFQDLEGGNTSPYTVSNSFVNLKGSTIYDLNVYKTYSGGLNTRLGCTTTDGSCSTASVDIDFDYLDNFTNGSSYNGYNYNIGNYDVFQFSNISDTNLHVFDASEYDTSDVNNSTLGINALFVADYYDSASNGKFYHIVVKQCDLGSAGNNYLPGILDAVDDNCTTLANCAGNKISTKIAGKSYDLKILDENASTGALFGTAIAYDNDGAIEYEYIGEVNATNQSGITSFVTENGDSTNNWSSISDKMATKEAWIQFYFCDSSPNWRDCYVVGGDNVYITKTYDANESSSFDKFSIRPKSYNIELNASDILALVAGRSYKLDVNATYDANSTNVENYKQLLLNTTDKNASNVLNPSSVTCSISGSDSFNANFVNGTFSLPTYTYNNTGDVNITLYDGAWTSIDRSNGGCDTDSTSTTSTPVGCDIQAIKQVRFTPANFSVIGTLSNAGNGFTYYSNDLNHSAMLDLNISAIDELGNVATNFTGGCFAKDINITIDANESGVIFGYDAVASSPLVISEGNFSDGSSLIEVNVNFQRAKNIVKNPIKPTLDVNVLQSDDGDINGTQSFDSATFVYGRVHVPRTRIVGGDLATIPLMYEVYCGEGCYDVAAVKALMPNTPILGKDSIYWYDITSSHLASDGNVSSTTNNSALDDGKVVTPSSIQMKYDGSFGYPFKATVEMIGSSWLIYNRFDENATSNEFNIEFANKSTLSDDENLSNVDSNIEIKTNRRLIW
jgi:hypothetical protein